MKPLAATALFALVGAFLLSHHELWRDELQTWLICRESGSLWELFKNKEYEGHPFAWYLINYLLTRCTANPVAMQCAHLLIASAAAYVLLRYSTFGWLQKVLLLSGYYFIYEYQAISRNYALGLLFFWGCCALYPLRRERPLLLASMLALTMQASVYSAMLALAYVAMLGMDYFSKRKLYALQSRQYLAMGGILLLGMGFAAFSMNPPADCNFATGWRWDSWKPIDAWFYVHIFWKSLVPIPQFNVHFWNSNILVHWQEQSWGGAVVLLAMVAVFAKRPQFLFYFVVGALGIYVFNLVKYIGDLRHIGHLWVLFLSAFWMAQYERPLGKFAHTLLYILLSVHCVAGLYAAKQELRHTFSYNQQVANYIKTYHLDSLHLIGDRDYNAVAVSSYLGEKMYHPMTGDSLAFVAWNSQRVVTDAERLQERTAAFVAAQTDGRGFLFVLGYPFPNPPADFPLYEVARFAPAVVETEEFYLYYLKN